MTSESDRQLHFSYGPYGSGDTGTVAAGDSTRQAYHFFRPWTLRHITSYQETIQGTAATVGVPNYPPSNAQTFDTTGAYRTISISGKRFDDEEYISNVDFIYNELNLVGTSSSINGNRYYYSVGLMWLTSNLQVAKHGYALTISQTNHTGELIEDDETILVAQGNLQFTFVADRPSELDYTLTLTEKRSVGNTVYNPTNSYPTA